MKQNYLAIAAFFITSLFFAQAPTGNLTIFSEDGDAFYLILNGEKQNDIPQTNLRIEELNQPYYNAKIQFEDKSLVELTKKSLAITDMDGVYMDVTYKIKRDKNNKNKLKLNFFSEIPVDRGYIAPRNVHVVHYGAPESPRTVSQITTSTTVANTGVGLGVNVGGVNMNININEPPTVYTQTTTTTVGHSQNEVIYNPRPSSGCNGKYAITPNDFSAALSSVKKQSFDDTKLKVAKQISEANCMNVNQIKQIANTINFEETKLEYVKFAYDYCIEPKNYFKLNDLFSFSSNVDDLTDFVQGR